MHGAMLRVVCSASELAAVSSGTSSADDSSGTDSYNYTELVTLTQARIDQCIGRVSMLSKLYCSALHSAYEVYFKYLFSVLIAVVYMHQPHQTHAQLVLLQWLLKQANSYDAQLR
jgi:hypothetical protein